MNLQQLKNTCAAYVEKTPGDLSVNGVDLFLIAANNARRGAELRHNFEMSRIAATLDIAGANGGALADATITQGEATAGIKEVVAITRVRSNGQLIPLDFTRTDIAIERDRTELEFDNQLWPHNRYPSDAQILAGGSSGSIVQRGRKLYIYPSDIAVTETTAVAIEGFGWLPAYTTYSNGVAEDFLVEYGAQYLQWCIILELNVLFRQYVPRQEGNLAPPKTERDEAWRDLLLWDSYMVDSNLTRSR